MNPRRRPKGNPKNFHNYAKLKPTKEKQKRSARADGKNKIRREPLPMKLRALPRSFWQQPNRTAFASPGLICSRLPPIIKEETLETLLTTEEFKQPEFVSAANTELLFSLFEIVDEDQRRQRKLRARGRGRPRKLKKAKAKAIRDEDPYLTSNATEELLPLLPTRGGGVDGLNINYQQVVAMLTSESGEPGNDYSHILSQLVVQL